LITKVVFEEEAKREGQIKGVVERSFLRFKTKVELDEGLKRDQIKNTSKKGRTRSVFPQERECCVTSLEVVRDRDVSGKSRDHRLVTKKEILEEVPERCLEGELLIRTSFSTNLSIFSNDDPLNPTDKEHVV
jgi:hypothetical protein